MKLLIPCLLTFLFLYAQANTNNVDITQSSSKIVVDNEIELLQINTINNEKVFEVVKIKPNSTFTELGYKKGDQLKRINNERIFNKKQLRTALNRQATEWENTIFDNDFSEDELNLDNLTFEEAEKQLIQ